MRTETSMYKIQLLTSDFTRFAYRMNSRRRPTFFEKQSWGIGCAHLYSSIEEEIAFDLLCKLLIMTVIIRLCYC